MGCTISCNALKATGYESDAESAALLACAIEAEGEHSDIDEPWKASASSFIDDNLISRSRRLCAAALEELDRLEYEAAEAAAAQERHASAAWARILAYLMRPHAVTPSGRGSKTNGAAAVRAMFLASDADGDGELARVEAELRALGWVDEQHRLVDRSTVEVGAQ